MDLPKININDIDYVMAAPKARMWRKWMEFDKEKVGLPAADFIDKHCELIAEVFPGLSADDLLDNLGLDDIILIYNQCLLALMQLLSSKLEGLGKNVGEAEN